MTSRSDSLRPAVFLDRDGVINERLPGAYVRRREEFHLLPGVAEAIRELNAAGFRVVVITNQQGVGKGLMGEAELAEIHAFMTATLEALGARIDAVYHCPHLADAGCSCRKPEPGLILRAARELDLDLGRSWMAGDAASDLEAARRAGCRAVFIGPSGLIPEGHTPVFPDLLSWVKTMGCR